MSASEGNAHINRNVTVQNAQITGSRWIFRFLDSNVNTEIHVGATIPARTRIYDDGQNAGIA